MKSVALEEGNAGGEPDLVVRAQRGDVRAFEQLYRLYVDRIYGLCMRLVRNTSAAEDCTQQAFVNAWTALPHFEARSSFGTWLHRIAANVALGDRRKVARFPQGLSAEVEGIGGPVIFDTPMEVRDIEAAIQALPDGARHVLVFCGIYGFSHAEVATMLGIAEGTCRAQLHRARELLRGRLHLDGK
ncbi:MAG TPA: sigma-70 family RNA polymerase sigma factor [Steroidobacteraceae bacterium]|nr:sigma-70 family RNA polymerase sigma factor [Steroidobacteraceae bacterium]